MPPPLTVGLRSDGEPIPVLWAEVPVVGTPWCAVNVREELGLIAVLEQPDVRLDTGLVVQEVVRTPRAAGITDSQWGEAVRRVEAPELVGDEVCPLPVADLAERNPWIQPGLAAERADDARTRQVGESMVGGSAEAFPTIRQNPVITHGAGLCSKRASSLTTPATSRRS